MSSGAPAGVVLTGGSSTRMGSDKALLTVDGDLMAVRVANALSGAGCRPVWCQGGDLDALTAAGLDVVADVLPGEGPLTAILAALEHAGGSDIVVAACDLVDLEADTVSLLLDSPWASHDTDPDVVVPDVVVPDVVVPDVVVPDVVVPDVVVPDVVVPDVVVPDVVVPDVVVATADGRDHLLARWSAGAAPQLAALIAAGVRSIHGALDTLSVDRVPVPSPSVRNVNRPHDLDG